MNQKDTDTGEPRVQRRILVIAPFSPHHDALHGGGRVVAQLVEGLAQRNRVALLTLVAPNDREPDERLRAACDEIAEVRFPSTWLDERRRAWRWMTAPLLGKPRWVGAWHHQPFFAALTEVAARWRPDVVQIESHVMAQYVGALRGSTARRVLGALEAATRAVEPRVSALRVLRSMERRAWSRYERWALTQVDAVVVPSRRDRDAVAPLAGTTPIVEIPFAVTIPARPAGGAVREDQTILFVASFAHGPNVDAALWLGRAIFPRILQRVPQARLILLGNAPPAEVRSLGNARVEVTGQVDDVEPYRDRATVMVAPLRLGGGTRVKVLEALAAGQAVVATSLACEGIGVRHAEHVLIADDESAFADAVVSLLLDPQRRATLGTTARTWARDNLDAHRRIAAYEHLYGQLLARSREAEPAAR